MAEASTTTETEAERVSRSQMYKHEDIFAWMVEQGHLAADASPPQVIAAFAAHRNAYRKTERYATLVASHAETAKAAEAEARAAREAEKQAKSEAREAERAAKEAAKAEAAKAAEKPAEKPAKATRKGKAKATETAEVENATEGDEDPFSD